MVGIEVRMTTVSNRLSDTPYTVEEQADIFDNLLNDIIANPRWYLDQLRFLPEFRVCWVDYARQNTTRPYKYVNKRK